MFCLIVDLLMPFLTLTLAEFPGASDSRMSGLKAFEDIDASGTKSRLLSVPLEP